MKFDNVDIIRSKELSNVNFGELDKFHQFVLIDEEIESNGMKYNPTSLCFLAENHMDCLYQFEKQSISLIFNDNQFGDRYMSKINKKTCNYLTVNDTNIELENIDKIHSYFDFIDLLKTIISEQKSEVKFKKIYYKNSNQYEFYLVLPLDDNYLIYNINNFIKPHNNYWGTVTYCYIVNKDFNYTCSIVETCYGDILEKIKEIGIIKDSKEFDYFMNTILPLHKTNHVNYTNYDKYKKVFHEVFNEIEPSDIDNFFKPIYINEDINFKAYLNNIMLFRSNDYKIIYIYDGLSDEILEREKRKTRAVIEYSKHTDNIDIYSGELITPSSDLELKYKEHNGLIYVNKRSSLYIYYTRLDNIYVPATDDESKEIFERYNLIIKLSE